MDVPQRLAAVLALAVCLAAAQAFAWGGMVEGRSINYPLGEQYVVDDAFTPLGSIAFIRPTTDANTGRKGSGSGSAAIFVKRYGASNEAAEVIASYAYLVPDGWHMKKSGHGDDAFFTLRVRQVPTLRQLFEDNKLASAEVFSCGEFNIYRYQTGRRSILFCVAASALPANAEPREFLGERFRHLVRPAGKAGTAQAQSAPPSDAAASPAEPATPIEGQKGRHVALAYSAIAKKLYAGRSYTSAQDALSTATATCPYSDCRSLFVNNTDGCVAFARHASGAWGKARGENPEEARQGALKHCNAFTKDDKCAIIGELCPAY